MPDFDPQDIFSIITPQTIIAVICTGIVLASYIWTTVDRIRPWSLFRIYVTGLAFILCMAASRWAALSPHWETWLGTAMLWTFYILITTMSLYAWRTYRRTRMAQKGQL